MAYLMCVGFHWHGVDASKSKVCNLEQLLPGINQQVLWLQVSMHDSMGMHESQSTHQLVHEGLHQIIRKDLFHKHQSLTLMLNTPSANSSSKQDVACFCQCP